MMRTLPTQNLVELEQRMPAALAGTTSVNALECKLQTQTYKVGRLGFLACLEPDLF